MTSPETLQNTRLLTLIATGDIGRVEVDKGGNYSPEHGIWVDQRLPDYLKSYSPEDLRTVEMMGSIGLGIGRIFHDQLDHADDGTMYPRTVIEDEDSQLFISSAEANPSLGDPYSLAPNLHEPTVPYSHAYREQLRNLSRAIAALAESDAPSAVALQEYTQALVRAYDYDPERTSDWQAMHEADEAWVSISPNAQFLYFAEPTEVYLDPARVAIGQDPQVAQWARNVTAQNHLGPWRNFFEFRLLAKDESMVTEDDVEIVRGISRELFASPDDKVVPASLEFRRLLLASGNGAFPAKTAKNYPNFGDIRDETGYKNVLYTNMIEEGAKTLLLPTLEQVFGTEFTGGIDVDQLTRGSALRVVAHEENHPFRRHSDTPYEELKATVNGVAAIIRSRQFSDGDVQAVLTSAIGAELYGRTKVAKAREEEDERTERGLEAYYKAGTIMMNYLKGAGSFSTEEGRITGISYDTVAQAFVTLADDLEMVRSGQTSMTAFNEAWRNESIWEEFGI